MNQEHKELLFKDLCVRLPYGVEVFTGHFSPTTLSINNFKNVFEYQCEPFYFPLSSLTKPIQLASYNNGEPFVPVEEIGKILLGELYHSFDFPKEDENFIGIHSKYGGWSMYNFGDYKSLPCWIIDLLNQWMIDYPGLIDLGLAIEVTEENNPYI